MGGKDSPAPCAATTPVQSPKWIRERSNTERCLPLSRKCSPIEYVPRSKSQVNIEMHWQSSSSSSGSPTSTLPRDPIRAYIDCLSPQSLKCAIVGDSGVGKTSLLMSYTVDKFPETHSPTIYDKFQSSLSVNGKRIALTLCDTSGQEDFAHLRPLCYPQVDVALICFSVVDPASYENVKTKWIKEIRRNCPGVPVVIVGTQLDERENPVVLKKLKAQGKKFISKSDGNKLAAQTKAACYIECSALTQLNVKNAFDEAISAALELNCSKNQTPQCRPSQCNIL